MKNKKGLDRASMIVTGIIIIILLIASGGLIFGGTFLDNSEFLSGVPIWFIGFFIIMFGIAIVRLITK